MRLMRTIALALSFGFALTMCAQTPGSWTKAVEPARVVGNIYYVGTEELGAYLITDAKGLVLLDAPYPDNAQLILDNIRKLGFDPKNVRVLIASHAHLDHIGSLPVLMRQQPQARVFMTEATAAIGDALLHNSVNVMIREREEVGVIYPLFTHREADRASDRWQHCPFGQPFTVEGERSSRQPNDALTFEYFQAGHVLGAAGILFRAEGRTIFYTGDVNFDPQTLVQGANFPESGIDVLIIEATRGDSPLPENFSREAEERRFADALSRAFARGGCVLVPVFALGKTQEILTMFYKFKRNRWIDDVPIYIGGLSSKMTEIYDRRANQSPRVLPRLQLFPEVRPFVLNGKTIADAPARPGRIYALSSGMMTPKTLSNIFARRIIERPEHSVFFVGYADPESPAGILRRSAPEELISLDEDEPAQSRRCQLDQFQFSAHASRESLVDYIRKLAPKKVVLVHGDPAAVAWMESAAATALPGSKIIVPPPGVEIEL